MPVCGLAGTNCSTDKLNVCVGACLDVDLFALLAVLDIEELQVTTRVLCHGAEGSASFTRT